MKEYALPELQAPHNDTFPDVQMELRICKKEKIDVTLRSLSRARGVMAAAPDLGSGVERRGGSSPPVRTDYLRRLP